VSFTIDIIEKVGHRYIQVLGGVDFLDWGLNGNAYEYLKNEANASVYIHQIPIQEDVSDCSGTKGQSINN
jgi:hypothetical protein